MLFRNVKGLKVSHTKLIRLREFGLGGSILNNGVVKGGGRGGWGDPPPNNCVQDHSKSL